MTNICMYGAAGHMGRVIANLVAADDRYRITAGVDPASWEAAFPVYRSLDEVKEPFDVIVDFSSVNALSDILDYCARTKTPVVLCTTGYSAEQIASIEEASKNSPIFRSANMSVGINLLSAVLREFSDRLYRYYDVEMIEEHHNRKLDAPSGTAVMLAEVIQKAIAQETKITLGRSGMKKRDANEIGIQAIRGGNIVGNHKVIFAGEGEVLEFGHRAISRDVFGVGALEAAAFMKGKAAGHYTMDDMLQLHS